MTRKLPPTASIATPGEGARLVAPSAERNSRALCDLLEQMAPRSGRALEIASGTGQHITAFASRLPNLHWQPSEIDADRRASIDAYSVGVDNVATAISLDATVPGWSKRHSGQDLIVLINLLHLISDDEVFTLIREAAQALAPSGRFVIYGPFKRGGELTSAGDERFHASLAEQDPEIGYKDDFDMIDQLQDAGLEMVSVVEMPANNLSLIAQLPGF
ncbi:DUF938 domain-containing protein [Primorskyibacter sp. S87]|uniref:DUF938 domain-containing protein n=1 Tax=Primorskyibacter sp. S87 TaxID=3415126 RepID=UPI003C7A0CE5